MTAQREIKKEVKHNFSTSLRKKKKNCNFFYITKSRKSIFFREETIFWMCYKNEMDIGKWKKGRSCFLLLANGILLCLDLDKGGLNRGR